MDIVRQSLAIVFVFALLWTALSFLRKKGWTRSWQTKAAPWLARIARQTGADRTALHSSDPDRRSEPDIGPSSGWRHFPRRRPGRSRLRAEGNVRDMKLSIRYSLGALVLANTLVAQESGRPFRGLFRAFQRIGFFERAHANHRVAHAAGRSAGRDYVGHSLSPHHGGAALPPPSPKHPGNAIQSGSDWSGFILDAGNHAAGGDGHVPQRMGTARGRTGDLATGLERWFATVEDLLATLCPGKRRTPFSGHLSRSVCRKIGPGSGWRF